MVINMVLDSIIFMIKFWIEDRVFQPKEANFNNKNFVYLYNKTEYTHCVRFVIVNLIRLVLFLLFCRGCSVTTIGNSLHVVKL